MSDRVNHPSHFTSHPSKVECITITEHHSFCIGNAIKYLWRAGLKDGANGAQSARGVFSRMAQDTKADQLIKGDEK